MAGANYLDSMILNEGGDISRIAETLARMNVPESEIVAAMQRVAPGADIGQALQTYRQAPSAGNVDQNLGQSARSDIGQNQGLLSMATGMPPAGNTGNTTGYTAPQSGYSVQAGAPSSGTQSGTGTAGFTQDDVFQFLQQNNLPATPAGINQAMQLANQQRQQAGMAPITIDQIGAAFNLDPQQAQQWMGQAGNQAGGSNNSMASSISQLFGEGAYVDRSGPKDSPFTVQVNVDKGEKRWDDSSNSMVPVYSAAKFVYDASKQAFVDQNGVSDKVIPASSLGLSGSPADQAFGLAKIANDQGVLSDSWAKYALQNSADPQSAIRAMQTDIGKIANYDSHMTPFEIAATLATLGGSAVVAGGAIAGAGGLAGGGGGIAGGANSLDGSLLTAGGGTTAGTTAGTTGGLLGSTAGGATTGGATTAGTLGTAGATTAGTLGATTGGATAAGGVLSGLTGLAGNAGVLGAVAGGLLGSQSGASPAGTTTTTTVPWDQQQPYLKDLWSKAQTQAGTPTDQSLTPGANSILSRVMGQDPTQSYMMNQTNSEYGKTVDPITNSYIGQTTKAATNPYLGVDNPYLQSMVDKSQRDINAGMAPQIATANRRAGSYGNSGVAEQYGKQLAQALSDSSNTLRFNDYSNQQQLAQNMGQFNANLSQADLARNTSATTQLGQANAGIQQTDLSRNADIWNTDINRNLGQYQTNVSNMMTAATNTPTYQQNQQSALWAPLKNYGSLVTGNAGSSISSPYFTNPTAGLLGGALAGAQLGGLFGNLNSGGTTQAQAAGQSYLTNSPYGGWL